MFIAQRVFKQTQNLIISIDTGDIVLCKPR